MRVGVILVPECFDSGLTSVFDRCIAEELRPDVDSNIPPELQTAGYKRQVKTLGGRASLDRSRMIVRSAVS